MTMTTTQSAILTLVFLVVAYVIYNQMSGNDHITALRRLTKVLILLIGVLMFININLISSARQQIRDQETVFRYTIPSTLSLIGVVHNPANKVRMDENHIYINEGTDNAQVYVVLGYPVFGIVDQSKLIGLYKELGGTEVVEGNLDGTTPQSK